MELINEIDLLRVKANSTLDPKKKSSLGQFFTPSPICHYMASLFNNITGEVTLLDPGCGIGSLTAAFVSEARKRKTATSIDASLYDIEKSLQSYIDSTLDSCRQTHEGFKGQFFNLDFILSNAGSVTESALSTGGKLYSHIILNPPYKKINSKSEHRQALRLAGVETVNLYTGFVAIAIKMLADKGELVAIIPRSFCNGPYYQPFRELLLTETSIQHIHIFDSRNKAFSDDDVLQENIIIHCIKGKKQKKVTITSSPTADFHIDKKSKSITATDMTTRTIPFDSLVSPTDTHKFIHIATNNRDQSIIDRLAVFSSSLTDIGLEVSTGPVVGFRLREDLRAELQPNSAPLLYPSHLNGVVSWPIESKKPNAINISEKSRPWLWDNTGCFLITRRFSSKEEKRRIVATFYESQLPGDLIGFENKLNVFHKNKQGINKIVAKGLYIYLNSSLLDYYYRQFSGHTQVNATDLRNLHYPSTEALKRIGNNVSTLNLNQKEIDNILDMEINMTANNDNVNPLFAQDKIYQSIEIITALGMPKAQQNERSGLTLLALLKLHPDGSWKNLERPMIGVTPIMDWVKDVYGKEYAPNTRETFRRQTLHQFIDGGLCLYNPDQPDRPVNSPKACYQITTELLELLTLFGTKMWEEKLNKFLAIRETLAQQYAMAREMEMIPLTLDNGEEIQLSAGAHSQLIKDIVTEFGPRFAPGSEVIYLGDTGAKEDFFRKERLAELGVTVDRKGKMPDVVLFWKDKNWLLLIESVTSHGPVDGKRHQELATLFSDAKCGLVYVTAFPDRKTMTKYLPVISWETEVWTADAPTHMIHFNGDKFLGPH